MSEGLYITMDTVKNISVGLGLLTALGGIAWKLFSWVNHQKEQDAKMAAMEQEIKELRKQHEEDMKAIRAYHDKDMKALRADTNDAFKSIQDELTLVVFGVLSSLKGQHEQGCNGPVTEAIDKLEKHINQKAHGQI